MRHLLSLLCSVSLSVMGAGISAHAAPITINFESEAASAPSMFTGQLNSPITIGQATFTGGQLLNNETNSQDQSGVYATRYNMGDAYSNPITITFASAVSDFSVFITNNLASNFQLTDNFGNVANSYIGYNDGRTLSLSGSGITSVQITQLSSDYFDFALDNVTFTPAAVASTPEPSSLWLLGTGVLGAATTLRRRLQVA